MTEPLKASDPGSYTYGLIDGAAGKQVDLEKYNKTKHYARGYRDGVGLVNAAIGLEVRRIRLALDPLELSVCRGIVNFDPLFPPYPMDPI